MKTVAAPRASAILYGLLRSRASKLPFLLPANICPIVPITFMKAGTPFEFVDISAETLHLDAGLVEKRLNSSEGRCGGILFAHTYGDPTTPEDFFLRCKERREDLLVIDDRCLCIPDLELPRGSSADVVLYSTGYAKIVDLGFGGFAYLGEHVPYERQRVPFDPTALRDLEAGYKESIRDGRAFTYQDSGWLQTESELPTWDEYAARVRMALPDALAHRRAINAVYNSLIPSALRLGNAYQLWRFNLRLANRDEILKAVFEAGLFASSHYRPLVGIMGAGSGERARNLSDVVINLFNDRHYTVDMAERTARIIKHRI